MKTTM